MRCLRCILGFFLWEKGWKMGFLCGMGRDLTLQPLEMVGDHSRRQHNKLSTLCIRRCLLCFFPCKKMGRWRDCRPMHVQPSFMTLFHYMLSTFFCFFFFFMDYGIFLAMIYVQPFMIFLFNFIDFLFSTCLWKEIKRNLTTMHRWCVILM